MGGAQRVSSYIRLLQDSRGELLHRDGKRDSEPLLNVHFDGLSVDTENIQAAGEVVKSKKQKTGKK
ncbi:hypothetical protein ES703_44795 [subsurface metagenome]